MNRTTENLLTWAPLGAGVALILSNHRHWGMAVAAISPITVATQHPRATRKALRAVPKGLASMGKHTGKALAKAGHATAHSTARGVRECGRSLRWMAS